MPICATELVRVYLDNEGLSFSCRILIRFFILILVVALSGLARAHMQDILSRLTDCGVLHRCSSGLLDRGAWTRRGAFQQ